MFKTNEGRVDRGLRIIAGLVLMVIGFGGVVSGGFGLLIGVLGLVALATGIAGFCPAYALLGMDTCEKDRATP